MDPTTQRDEPVVAIDDELTAARSLLGTDREAAFEAGCAPALSMALSSPVTKVVSSERTPQYLTLLYALLLFRRGHELEPRHDDLYARVLGPLSLHGAHYGPEPFAADLKQLCDWGAVDQQTEPTRLRGYKDKRRVQYRYRVTDDALALLEWLEARLAARIEGRVRDSRDRLTDVVGLLKECRRLLDKWRKGEPDGETARRAYYLVEAASDAVAEISDELLAFRAEMIGFSQRPYSVDALRAILDWLEHYVDLYVKRVRELRVEIRDRIEQLRAPRYGKALGECDAALAHERAVTPRLSRSAAALRPAHELLDHLALFFRHHGQMDDLCRYIDDSVRQVVTKMHRHVRELERRNARLDDVRGTISALARTPAGAPGYADHLLASAHARFDMRPGTHAHRAMPPTPRKTPLLPERRAGDVGLRDKLAAPAQARALRAKALAQLAQWLEQRVLDGRDRTTLADAKLGGHDDVRRWMDVVRCQRLAGGKNMRPLGVLITDADHRITMEDETCGMSAPDAHIRRRKP